MNGPMSRPNNAATIRGLLLVIVAVAVGIYLLRGTDTPTLDATSTPTPITSESSQDETDAGQQSEVGSTATTLPGITVATSAPGNESNAEDSDAGTMIGFEGRPNAQVKVQVANSTTVRGAAGRTTDFLKTKTFMTENPINQKRTPLDRTRIYYEPGSIIEAGNIAILLELDEKNDVYKMPTDKSAWPGIAEPHVVVALGIDKASAE